MVHSQVRWRMFWRRELQCVLLLVSESHHSSQHWTHYSKFNCEKSLGNENRRCWFVCLLSVFKHLQMLCVSNIGSLANILNNYCANLPKETKNTSSASNFIVLAIFNVSLVSFAVVGSNKLFFYELPQKNYPKE